MSDKMKPVTPSASIARPANVADHSSPALPEGSADNAGRPYQKAIDLKDLTDEERHQLTKLLEAELARL